MKRCPYYVFFLENKQTLLISNPHRTQIFITALLLILLSLSLLACTSQEWVCESDFDGRKATTRVDTYYYQSKDGKFKDAKFCGGNCEVIIQNHCIKGSTDRFQVKGETYSSKYYDGKTFYGWVDSHDLDFH